jgi:predicted lipid-binding transport protein (Tim44 family)
MQRFGPMLGGLVLGGLLGGLLFGGGFGHGFGGIGLMDILLIGGAIFAVMYFLRRRREAAAPAYAGASAYSGSNTGAGGTAVMEMPAVGTHAGELEQGLGHIRSMDPGFDPAAFAEAVRAQFGSVQAAVGARDASMIRDRLTPEMFGVLLTQCEELRAARRTNHVEKIDLARLEVSEAWQERGQDFVTVYVEGSMLDYTTDDATGQVVDGSKTTPAKVEEFWTFTRPVGPNRWKLTAIQTA